MCVNTVPSDMIFVTSKSNLRRLFCCFTIISRRVGWSRNKKKRWTASGPDSIKWVAQSNVTTNLDFRLNLLSFPACHPLLFKLSHTHSSLNNPLGVVSSFFLSLTVSDFRVSISRGNTPKTSEAACQPVWWFLDLSPKGLFASRSW